MYGLYCYSTILFFFKIFTAFQSNFNPLYILLSFCAANIRNDAYIVIYYSLPCRSTCSQKDLCIQVMSSVVLYIYILLPEDSMLDANVQNKTQDIRYE